MRDVTPHRLYHAAQSYTWRTSDSAAVVIQRIQLRIATGLCAWWHTNSTNIRKINTQNQNACILDARVAGSLLIVTHSYRLMHGLIGWDDAYCQREATTSATQPRKQKLTSENSEFHKPFDKNWRTAPASTRSGDFSAFVWIRQHSFTRGLQRL